jgi:hypothetical protein
MQDYGAIFTEAKAAAVAAVAEMQKTYAEGYGGLDCGFAWVTIPGTEPLARYCRKMAAETGGRQYGSKGYPTGWQFWNPGEYGGQSIGFKEAGAKAFQMALAKYGISGTVGSRLD